MKTIGLASDHAGYPLKEQVKEWLKALGYEFVDFGTHSTESCNYPEFAHALAEAIEKGISGRVIFEFVVEKDGSLTEFDVLQSPDKSLADEVVRILKTSPKWEPGEQRGEKVRVKYTVPIVFSIAD